jgi:hypothetical protein
MKSKIRGPFSWGGEEMNMKIQQFDCSGYVVPQNKNDIKK